jgi:protein involved in polysaccharide export with SLBB domain
MMRFKYLAVSLLGVALLLSHAANASAQGAQDSNRPAQTNRRDWDPATGSVARKPGASELESENLRRVAAPAAMLRTILVKDPGLMVELKRLVAQEATNNGQVVEDADLTDQGIFERLDRDVEFRSLATRLVQRYGYLQPTANPDSQLGKQEDLLLKERVRRQVQVEAQEDNQPPQAAKELTAAEKLAKCEESEDAQECEERIPSNGRNVAPPSGGPSLPSGTLPEQLPISPQLPRDNQLIQTAGGGQGQDTDLVQGLLTRQSAGSGGSAGLGGTSTDGTSGETSMLMASNPQRSAGMSSLGGSSLLVSPSDLFNPSSLDLGAGNAASAAAMKRKASSRRTGLIENETNPESLVHRPNPFSDVPSLYEMYAQAAPRETPRRFGLSVFRNQSQLTAAVPMDLPVGPEYVVGPGDGLAIDVWGGVSQRLNRVVDREGRLNLPEAGPVLVSGKTLGEVQMVVQQALRSEFRDVSADVSLARLRTVRIYVVGDVVEPGAYDISSLSTPLNAIYAAGGITQRGSLRKLKHFRGKTLVEEVDAYDLLLHGVQGDLKHLENGDSLMVPPLGPTVTVDGMVRRPANYELNGEKTLADVIELAGGILPTGTLSHIELQRIEAHEKRTMMSVNISAEESKDAAEAKLKEFVIADGDEVHVFPIAPFNEDAIFLQGHVVRPGRYSYTKGMTVADLVSSYKDLLPEPAGHYAEIVRINPPDNHPSVESFDLAAALDDKTKSPKLQALDTVRVFSRYDFEAAPAVWVGGEVRKPGRYTTSGQVHLRDAVYLAGGVSPDAAGGSAQVFRTQADGTLKIFSVNLKEALSGSAADNILLVPRDRLLIHKNTARVEPATVYVKGEVAKPGRYPLTENMHLQDLIGVAGGMKRSASTDDADLTRYPEANPDVKSVQHVNVDLPNALAGESSANLPLRDGDVLTIKPIPGWNDIGAAATVRGEVEHPGTYGIKPGERLSSVLARAGGFTNEASPYGAVLMRREVRDLEMSAHLELVDRIKSERVHLQELPENTEDQRNAKLNALGRADSTLQQVERAEPIGRVVIHISEKNGKGWTNSPNDVALRDGDVLVIPKKANYVLVNGQVFNPTAVSYLPGHSAKWYLSQAGGLTPSADKKAVFVIRADGSVLGARNNSGLFAGDALNGDLRPGDTVIVPEKAPKIGGPNFTNVIQAGQLAASVAIAVAYIHP